MGQGSSSQIVSKLVSDVEQIPFGCEVSGVVTKGTTLAAFAQRASVTAHLYHAVGSSVSKFVVGDSVTGLLPLDTECPGCAEYCTVPEYCLGKSTGILECVIPPPLPLSLPPSPLPPPSAEASCCEPH